MQVRYRSALGIIGPRFGHRIDAITPHSLETAMQILCQDSAMIQSELSWFATSQLGQAVNQVKTQGGEGLLRAGRTRANYWAAKIA